MNIIDEYLELMKSIILLVIKQNENDSNPENNLNKYLRRYKMYRTQRSKLVPVLKRVMKTELNKNIDLLVNVKIFLNNRNNIDSNNEEIRERIRRNINSLSFSFLNSRFILDTGNNCDQDNDVNNCLYSIFKVNDVTKELLNINENILELPTNNQPDNNNNQPGNNNQSSNNNQQSNDSTIIIVVVVSLIILALIYFMYRRSKKVIKSYLIEIPHQVCPHRWTHQVDPHQVDPHQVDPH